MSRYDESVLCGVCHDVCASSIDEVEYEDDTVMLECKHVFHKECLRRHFKQACPLCNAPQHRITVTGKLPSEEVDDDLPCISVETSSGMTPSAMTPSEWFSSITASTYVCLSPDIFPEVSIKVKW